MLEVVIVLLVLVVSIQVALEVLIARPVLVVSIQVALGALHAALAELDNIQVAEQAYVAGAAQVLFQVLVRAVVQHALQAHTKLQKLLVRARNALQEHILVPELIHVQNVQQENIPPPALQLVQVALVVKQTWVPEILPALLVHQEDTSHIHHKLHVLLRQAQQL